MNRFHIGMSALLIVLTVAGCQKGPEDPVFSLATRKGRLSGSWEVKSATITAPSIQNSYSDSTMTYVLNDSTSYSRTFGWGFRFTKDGTYEIEAVEHFPEDTANNSPAYVLTQVEKGHWEFTGGNNTPSKSQLLLLATEISTSRTDQGSNVNITTIEGPMEGTVYDIIRLANEELKLSFEETTSYSTGSVERSSTIELTKLQ